LSTPQPASSRDQEPELNSGANPAAAALSAPAALAQSDPLAQPTPFTLQDRRSYAEAVVQGSWRASINALDSRLSLASALASILDSAIEQLSSNPIEPDCAYALSLVCQFAINTAHNLAIGTLKAYMDFPRNGSLPQPAMPPALCPPHPYRLIDTHQRTSKTPPSKPASGSTLRSNTQAAALIQHAGAGGHLANASPGHDKPDERLFIRLERDSPY
jgi:hypothetical protein